MSKGPSTLRRLVASSALLVWSALAAVLPSADAAAERASGDARSHVEAVGGSASCTPVHDQLACQLCRLLRLPSKAGNSASHPPVRAEQCPAVDRTELVVAAASSAAGNLSRAPPRP